MIHPVETSCQTASLLTPSSEISSTKNQIEFRSKSFLQQQVRSMVGCLKYLSTGKWSITDFKRAFKSKKRDRCAPPAPAHGLFLEKVIY